MHYLYVLQSVEDEPVFYVGSTSDLRRRVREHNRGGSRSTAGKRWRLVYYEAYVTRAAACEREQRLKRRGRSKQLLFERIRRHLE